MLRTFRVVRPLRALNRFPELRVLVQLLMATIPMLASVALLCFFIFFVFGILAVQLWMGLFHQRCYEAVPATWEGLTAARAWGTGDETDPYLCTISSLDQNGMNFCPPNYGDETHCTVLYRTALYCPNAQPHR